MINRISELAIVIGGDGFLVTPDSVNTGTDTITASAHGLRDGMKIRYDNANWTIGGLTDQADYFVISATTNTFQLSTTLGGSAVNLTSQSGSGSAFRMSPIKLKNINEGVDNAATFGYSTDRIDINTEDGQTVNIGVNNGLNIAVLRENEWSANLDYITENQLDCWVSGLTPSGFLAIGGRDDGANEVYRTKLVKNDQFTNPFSMYLTVTQVSLTGYENDIGVYESGWYEGENALSIFKWADADGDGVANGWEGSGS